MITLEVNDSPDSYWNKRLIESNFGTESQIDAASYQFISNKQSPKFLFFLNNSGKIIAQLLLSELNRFSENPHKKKSFKNKLYPFSDLLSNMHIKTKLYRWAYGPVIFDKIYSNDVYLRLSEFLLKNNSHQVVGWQHPLIIEGFSSLQNKFRLKKWGTFLIDLSKSKEELFNNIDRSSGRKNINKAIKNNIQIEPIDENNLFQYFELLNLSKNNLGGLKNNFEYFVETWKSMEKFGRKGFLAKKDDLLLSGINFSSISGHIIENGVARSVEDQNNSFYTQDLLRCKIIEWGVDNQMKWYNLAGFNPSPETNKEKGILRYKKKWGGKQFNYYGIHLK